MSQKLSDFLSSFGLMIAGVCALVFFTISFQPVKSECRYRFPVSQPRSTESETPVGQNLPASRPVFPLLKDNNDFSATMTAFAAYVVDEKSGMELFAKNSDQVRPLASITKLMSAITLLQLPINWEATTTILESDCDNSSHQLSQGEVYSFNDLFEVALIGSSNIAIRALVRESGVSRESFVAKMNDNAEKLNLKTLHFVEPTGLDAGNVGSARDVAGLLKEAMQYTKIKQVTKTGEYILRPLNEDSTRLVWSTNWLLTNWMPNNFPKEEISGKTGFIGDARYNFVVRLTDGQRHGIITAVLGAADSQARFSEARDLSNWIFDQYVWPDEEGYDIISRE